MALFMVFVVQYSYWLGIALADFTTTHRPVSLLFNWATKVVYFVITRTFYRSSHLRDSELHKGKVKLTTPALYQRRPVALARLQIATEACYRRTNADTDGCLTLAEQQNDTTLARLGFGWYGSGVGCPENFPRSATLAAATSPLQDLQTPPSGDISFWK